MVIDMYVNSKHFIERQSALNKAEVETKKFFLSTVNWEK